MSNNIGRTEVAPAQNQKEVTINDSDGRIDAALTEPLTSDYTSADITLTASQFQQAVAFITSNLTVARALNVPQTKKLFIVDNTAGTNTVTVTRGTGTVVIPATEKRLCYTDGSTNGLIEVGGGGGSSSYDFGFTFGTEPAITTIIQRVQISRAITIPADMAGSTGSVSTNPTSTYAMDVKDDGVSIGTVSISTGGVFTFTTTSGTAKNIAAGSVLTFITPGTLDGTVAGVAAGILATED